MSYQHHLVRVTKYDHQCDSRNLPARREPVEWSVLGFTTSDKEDINKVRTANLLNENVSGLENIGVSLRSLESISAIITSESKVYPANSEAELAAKALSEKIERFRAELFCDYLDLVTDPEFLVAAIKLGDRVSISDHSLNEDSE
jgi:hypothetical protein